MRLKKRLFAFYVATALFLIGCENKSAEQDTEKPVVSKHPEEVLEETIQDLKQLEVDPGSFHFVADWLTDEDIIIVEKNKGLYQIKRFNIKSGEIHTIYEDPSIIIDVLIHPSKDFLLIHTSDNPLSATVKILTINGLLEEEVVVESSELGIEWNTIDPYRVLLTAFHEDWSFDLFSYDGHEDMLELVDLNDPFPKWFGSDQIATKSLEDHSLDGGSIQIYNPATKKSRQLDFPNVVYFDTYMNKVLAVQVNDDEEAVYTVMEEDGTPTQQWTMPAISNYSEWIIPEITWIAEDDLFMTSNETGGLLDELQAPYQLVRIKEKSQTVVVENVDAVKPNCSPTGKRCLMGYSKEILIDTETGKIRKWLSFPEN